MQLEEGGAVYQVLWCQICNRGYKNKHSFLNHFLRKSGSQEEGSLDESDFVKHCDITPADRLKWATSVTAQELCLQPGHRGYFQVCITVVHPLQILHFFV